MSPADILDKFRCRDCGLLYGSEQEAIECCDGMFLDDELDFTEEEDDDEDDY